jgi:hypothetical protein
LETFPSDAGDVEVVLVVDGAHDSVDRQDLMRKVHSISMHMPFRLMYTDLQGRRGPGYVRNLGIKAAVGKYIHFVDDDDLIDYTSYRNLIAFCGGASSDIIIGRFDDSSGVMSNHEFLSFLPALEITTRSFASYLLQTGFEPLQIQQFLFLKSSLVESCLLFPDTFLVEDIAFTASCIVSLKTVVRFNCNIYTYLSRIDSTKTLDTPWAAVNHLAAIRHMLEYCHHPLEKGELVSAVADPVIVFMRNSISRILFLFLVRIHKFRGASDLLFDALLGQEVLGGLRQAITSLSSLCNETASKLVPKNIFCAIDDLENKILPPDPIAAYLDSHIWNLKSLENIYVVCFGPLGKSLVAAIYEYGYEKFSVVDDRADEFKASNNFAFISFDELRTNLSSPGNHCLLICNPNTSVARRINSRLLSIIESIELYRVSPACYNIIDLCSSIIDT